jgi:hypothetical protein
MMKLPFDCFVGTEREVITNPFSGESCELAPEAVAVYDTIRGCEMISDYKTMRKGLDWFRRYFPAEYMILLD